MGILAELSRKLGVLADELNTDAIIEDAEAFAAKKAEIEEVLNVVAQVLEKRDAQVKLASLPRLDGRPEKSSSDGPKEQPK